MPKTTWIFVVLFTALGLFGILGLQLRQRAFDLHVARTDAYDARTFAEGAMKTNFALSEALITARTQIELLENNIQQVATAQSELEKTLRGQLESKDVTISELQGKLTVNILDRVLFDSGAATLKPDGEEVLSKVAQILANHPNRQVQVIGHTDNVPIRGTTRGGFSDNWELSAGRAVAAVRFLQDKAGVDPHRLAAVGYGEFHPLAENTQPEGRAKNRRIAVVVMPEEIAPNDLPKISPSSPPHGVRPTSRSFPTNIPSTNTPAENPPPDPDTSLNPVNLKPPTGD